MKEYPQHIKILINEAKLVPLDSKQYWKLRATYLEKYLDPTYGEQEQSNCMMLYDILRLRTEGV